MIEVPRHKARNLKKAKVPHHPKGKQELIHYNPPPPPNHHHITTLCTHAPTNAPTHARPSLPINPNPNPTPAEEQALGLHYTAALFQPSLAISYSHQMNVLSPSKLACS